MNKQKLIEDNLNLVYSVISKRYPNCIKDEDIIQCGRLGLCKAADRWDENLGAFSTFAYKCITNEIKLEFRRRYKHPKQLSLEYEVKNRNGDDVLFGELLVGDRGIEYIDLKSIPNHLSDKGKEIFKLLLCGNTPSEISIITGYSVGTINWHKRKIKKLISEEGVFVSEESI